MWTPVTSLRLESQISWLSTQLKKTCDSTLDINELWLHLDSSPITWKNKFSNKKWKIILVKVCSEPTILFPQQTINFQQNSINLHFQGQHSDSWSACTRLLQSWKILHSPMKESLCGSHALKNRKFAYKDCVVCSNKRIAARTCGSSISDAKATTSNVAEHLKLNKSKDKLNGDRMVHLVEIVYTSSHVKLNWIIKFLL